MSENETSIEEPVEEAPVQEPEQHHAKPKHPAGGNRFERLKTWYVDRRKWTIPASVLLLILVLAGIPFTRYNAAGLVLKRDFAIRLVDSSAKTPVSGATVTIDGQSAISDGTGKVTLHAKVGNRKFHISKKYYALGDANLMVPILKQKQVPDVPMTATGRQVKISVVNKITKKSLSGVDIKVADISAKTDEKGDATIVLPAGVSQQTATLSHDNYNDAKVTVKVSNDKIQENDFGLTPAGKVYFLSKLSGKIDVVKTNLDGTDRQTVLAGTGKEDDTNTVLLASRDWKYLALLSKRAGGNNPSLYLINTGDDSLSTIDEGNVDFGIIGWSDDDFVYTVTRGDVQLWQPNRQALKSFDAPSKKLTILDQTAAQGTDQYNHANENYGSVYLIGKNIVYDKSWDNYYAFLSSPDPVTGKLKSGIYGVNTSGGNKVTFKTFDNTLGWYLGIDSVLNKPDEIYYQVTDPYQISLHGGGSTYYEYDNGKLTAKNDIADDYNNYDRSKTYLISPDDNSTFWFEPRDGKNTLFTGDELGDNGKQIASLSEYKPYGWYTDEYLLVSKSDSELYIMPKDGSQSPIKISDYHKPAVSFYGYGGGYGGI